MLPLRFLTYIFCAILIVILWGSDSGKLSGCAQDFVTKSGENMVDKFKNVWNDVFENYAGLQLSVYWPGLGYISCALTVSVRAQQFHEGITSSFNQYSNLYSVLIFVEYELRIESMLFCYLFEQVYFLQEYRNGCYYCSTFLIAKVLSDIPFNLILPNLASFMAYLMTGQPTDPTFRPFDFAMIFILLTFNSSALGFLIGALLAEHPMAIGFLGMLSLVPLITLSG